MLSRSPGHLWTFILGLGALGSYAVFNWPELVRSSARELDIAPMVVGFVLYVLCIGHAIYVRYYRNPSLPDTGHRPRSAHPVLWWMGTIVVVGAFSVGVGLGFPSVMEDRFGRFVVQSIVMGLIAAGLVLTVTGPPRFGSPRPSNALPRPPGFLRSGLRILTYQLAAMVVAVVLFGPIYLVSTGFDHWIDIPACKRACESHEFSYDSFRATKTSYDCVCATPQGLTRFHDRAYVTGGHGFFAALLDFFVRAGSVIVVLLLWLGVILGLIVWFSRKKGVRWEGGSRGVALNPSRRGDLLGFIERLAAQSRGNRRGKK